MKETYKDYFNLKTAAERYARGRPRFHSLVVDRIGKYLGLDQSLKSVLDVGCGTGLSSAALKAVSEQVVGIDISEAMLAQAENCGNIEYLAASAENLPFGTGEFDLITISQAVHWIDRDKFFEEAGRVLKPGALIAAYDNYFQGQMPENPRFGDWFKDRFLINYPTPARGARVFASESENVRDFVLQHQEFNENTLEFSADELVNYLLTISNVIAKIENGSETVEEVSAWLTREIDPFFETSRMKFLFVNPIWYLRRNN